MAVKRYSLTENEEKLLLWIIIIIIIIYRDNNWESLSWFAFAGDKYIHNCFERWKKMIFFWFYFRRALCMTNFPTSALTIFNYTVNIISSASATKWNLWSTGQVWKLILLILANYQFSIFGFSATATATILIKTDGHLIAL